jgi:hypothetical protein
MGIASPIVQMELVGAPERAEDAAVYGTPGFCNPWIPRQQF